jgi:hypothetical protein
MKLRARNRFRTTLVVLCALLLSQWSLASHACPLYAALGDAIEIAAAVEQSAPIAHADCDREDEASTICVKRCLGEDQATAQPLSAAAPPVALNWTPPEGEANGTVLPAMRRDLAQAHAPPLTILYCISLT